MSATAASDDAVIDVDVPCVQCGYNLRGLPPPARCPECAQPAHRSIEPQLLRFAEPAWLAKVALGVGATAAGVVVSLVTGAVILLGVRPFPALRWTIVASLLSMVLLAVGAWFTTARRGSGAEARWRTIVRLAVAANAAGFALGCVVLIAGDARSPLRYSAIALTYAANKVAFWIGVFAWFRHAAVLLDRVPRSAMSSAAGRLAILFLAGVAQSILVIVLATANQFESPLPSPWDAAAISLVQLLNVLTYVGMIWSLVWQWQYGQILRQQIALARELGPSSHVLELYRQMDICRTAIPGDGGNA